MGHDYDYDGLDHLQEHHHNDSQDDLHEMDGEKISWTYSYYMQGLDQEDILNRSSSSIFSSLFANTDNSIISSWKNTQMCQICVYLNSKEG